MAQGTPQDPMAAALVAYRETRTAYQAASGAHEQAQADVTAATTAASAKATERDVASTSFGTAIDALVEHLRSERASLV